MKSLDHTAHDFDLIAEALAVEPGDRLLSRPERRLLAMIPPRARTALDVGCGHGLLSRALARRGLTVTAVDVSPQMVALAQQRTSAGESVEYRVADVMHRDAIPGRFDVVMSVNVVHHLPLELIVPRLADLVAPGGVLLIQDVVTREGLQHLPRNVAAAIVSRTRAMFQRTRMSRRVTQLYREHGRGETYLAPEAVGPALRTHLPEVGVEHHLDWRYTAIWTRERGVAR